MIEQELKAGIFRLIQQLAKENPTLLQNFDDIPFSENEVEYINLLRKHQLRLQSFLL